MSISSFCFTQRSVFDDNFMHGEGALPKALPLPVVKQIRLAPLAICPVALIGSYPGESIKTRPGTLILSA